MAFELRTKRGHDFFEVASGMQKAIRRGLPDLAGYCALELFHSGYAEYVWKRLMTISAEDCWGLITKEVYALYEGYKMVNKNKDGSKGRVFVSKAVLLLCDVAKSRDADHLQNFIYDKTDVEIEEFLENVEGMEDQDMPEYVYDVHTKKGKRRGKTKNQFMVEEYDALHNKQKGLFDDVIDDLR